MPSELIPNSQGGTNHWVLCKSRGVSRDGGSEQSLQRGCSTTAILTMPNISIYSRDALLSLCSMGTTPPVDLLQAVKVPPPCRAQQQRRGKRGGILQRLRHRSSRPCCWACYSAMHDPCGVKWTSFGITREHVSSTGSRACWCSQRLGSIWIFKTPSLSWRDSLLSARTLRGSVVGESFVSVSMTGYAGVTP